MANTKFRKSMSSQSKGLIALVILVALTVFVSCLAIGGMKLDKDGIQVLLPWVPTSSENWPESLPLSRALGGGTYTEFTVTVPDGTEDAAAEEMAIQAEKTLKQRLSKLGVSDYKVVRDGLTLRLELPVVDESTLSYILDMSAMPGRVHVTDPDNNVLLTEKEIRKIDYSYNGYSYNIVLTLTDEASEKVREAGDFTFLLDGGTVTSTATFKDHELTLAMGSDLNFVNNVAFLLANGTYEADLTQEDQGAVENTSASSLKVILIAAAVILAAELIAAVLMGKLTGVSAIWAVWCAVIVNLFFFATLILTPVTVAIAVALIVGIVLACVTANLRVSAVSKAVANGSAPKQAVKAGFRTTARKVWLYHGAVLAAAIILMIIPAVRNVGYTLASGVVASAFAMLLMRIFLCCFTAISKKPALFGKAK